MDATLSDVICYLVSQRQANFFARILTGMRIERTTSSRVTSMAVMLQDRNYVLLYNEAWLRRAPYDHVVVVIEHEAHHLILEHIPRQLRADAAFIDEEKKLLFETVTPFAADLADNSLLHDYSTSFKKLQNDRGMLYPGSKPFEKLPVRRSYEWYLTELMREAKKKHSKMQQLARMCMRAGLGQEGKSEEYRKGFRDGWNKAREDQEKGQGQGQEQQQGQQEGQQEGQQQGQGQGQEQQEGQGQGQGQQEGQGEGQGQQEGSGGGKGQGSGKPGFGGGQNSEPQPGDSDYSVGFRDGYQSAQDAQQALDGLDILSYEMLSNHRLWKQEADKMNIDDKLAIADELEHHGKRIVKKAVEDQKKNRGTVPGHLQDLIDEMLSPPKIPWTSILRNKVINTQRYKYKRSVRRPKRRHIGIPQLMKFPGRSKDRAFTVAFLVDTSGSMGEDELVLAMSELQGLQKADKDIEIHFIQADVTVTHISKIGPNDEIKCEFYGRGGTDFNYALIEAKEIQPDICFYYTDGWAPAPDKKNRLACPLCWVITPGGKIPDPDYGFVIPTGDINESGGY